MQNRAILYSAELELELIKFRTKNSLSRAAGIRTRFFGFQDCDWIKLKMMRYVLPYKSFVAWKSLTIS
jgi:hypothetical protein